MLPTMAASGPDSTTKWLMDDPATMLDLGILNLNVQLAARSLGSAGFLYDENRINIRMPAEIFWADFVTPDEVEKRCAKWVDDVRGFAGVQRETGNAFYENTRFADLFRHQGFEIARVPSSLYTDLCVPSRNIALIRGGCHCSSQGLPFAI